MVCPRINVTSACNLRAVDSAGDLRDESRIPVAWGNGACYIPEALECNQTWRVGFMDGFTFLVKISVN